MRKTTLTFSLAAGLVGGAISHYVCSPRAVQAQSQTVPRAWSAGRTVIRPLDSQ